MGNGGMKQKVAGNGILKENKKNWIEIPMFAALVAIASAVTLPAVCGKYAGNGIVSFRYEGIYSGDAGTG